MTTCSIGQRCRKTKSVFHAKHQFEAEYVCTHASVQMPVVLLDDKMTNPKFVFAVSVIILMSYDHTAALIQQRLVRILWISKFTDCPFNLFCWVVVS